MNKKLTEDEHYVAQVHLKGFSPEYEQYKQDKKTKCFIYYYDLINNTQQKAVPVDSVCFKRNIYEFTDSNGEYVLQNRLENIFGSFERMFGKYRSQLEQKVFNEENYKCKSFLAKEEKVFWVTFILIQLLRSPQSLETAEKISKEFFANEINDNQARNIARIYCLPFYKEIKEDSPEASLFNMLLTPMLNMSFAVCVNTKGDFITSDKALNIYTSEFPCKEYERIVFPVTSEICLILLGGKEKEKCEWKNFLFPADDEIRKMIFTDMVISASEKIFANHVLGPEELNIINKAYADNK